MLKTFTKLTCIVVALTLLTAVAQAGKGPAYTDPEKADADFAVQGEYTGTVKMKEGDMKMGVQVIALGKGKFRAVHRPGGLPGDGWNKKDMPAVESEIKDGEVLFECDHGKGLLKNGVIIAMNKEGEIVGELKKVLRVSCTLGAKPPKGAVVVFDGKSLDHWEKGTKMTEDGLLVQGALSKTRFGSHTLHLEFCLPYMPLDRGQGRGNSGLYVQGRYEIQMLDSFGLEGKDNECGGIYKIGPPAVNMCYPPLSWQTYDVDLTAAKYDGSGKKTANARITVKHNGVVVHDNVELPGHTGGCKLREGAEPGPIFVQNHGNPVRYRNIWVVEKK